MTARVIRAESFVCRAEIDTPVVNAFGSMAERVAVFVRLTDEDGVAGWGEIWSNFPTIGAEHRARLFDAFIAPRLLGREITDPAAWWAETDRALHLWGLQAGEPGAFSAALAGADLALHDLLARRAGVPLWRYWGGTDAGAVPVYASGLNPDAQALEQVEEARGRGYRNFKIKIGFGTQRDLATLRPVFAGLHEGERVMVDINQGWDLRTATRMVQVLGEFPLAWIEEPLAADRPSWEWAQVSGASRAAGGRGEPARHSRVPPRTGRVPPGLRAAGLLQMGRRLGDAAGGTCGGSLRPGLLSALPGRWARATGLAAPAGSSAGPGLPRGGREPQSAAQPHHRPGAASAGRDDGAAGGAGPGGRPGRLAIRALRHR